MDSNYSIGERIRQIRLDLGYNRERFAEMLDISASTLANIELGRTQISQMILLNLYKTFGISSDYVLHGTKKLDTTQNKINRIVSNLNKDKSRYIYKFITEYVSLHK